MKYSIVLCLILSFLTGTGQTKNLNPSEKIDISTYIWKVYDSLKAKGASNLISVERSFFGMHILDSLGGPDIYFDIFWELNNTTYFQEIKYYTDTVIRNSVKVVHNSEIFPFMTSYYDSIKSEEILPCIIKSKKNDIESYQPLMPIHKANYDILFFSKNEMFVKEFEGSYLREDLGKDYPNLNYRFNNSTKLMVLWKKIWEIIKNEKF